MEKARIAVVMTVFNRVEKTKRCIDSILTEKENVDVEFKFYITNDGCTDNTPALLEEYRGNYPDVTFVVLQGTGDLFWNRGMHLAYGKALEDTEVDYYLWVNNDVQFKKGFLKSLLSDSEEALKKNDTPLICGSVSYYGTEELSYGGVINLSKTNPYKRKKVLPSGSIQKCDCINGNCIFIPQLTAIKAGNMDGRYEHGFGDFDYGYMVKAMGGQPYVASQYVGYCDRNTLKGTWHDPSVPMMQRYRKKNSVLGQPPKSHRIFLKKWFPKMWFYYWVSPYVSIFVSSVKYRLTGKGRDFEHA